MTSSGFSCVWPLQTGLLVKMWTPVYKEKKTGKVATVVLPLHNITEMQWRRKHAEHKTHDDPRSHNNRLQNTCWFCFFLLSHTWTWTSIFYLIRNWINHLWACGKWQITSLLFILFHMFTNHPASNQNCYLFWPLQNDASYCHFVIKFWFVYSAFYHLSKDCCWKLDLLFFPVTQWALSLKWSLGRR